MLARGELIIIIFCTQFRSSINFNCGYDDIFKFFNDFYSNWKYSLSEKMSTCNDRSEMDQLPWNSRNFN